MTQAFGVTGEKKGLPSLKTAVRKLDPMLDIYSKEGLFGIRPGMVKGERGEEVPVEKVIAIEAKKRADEKVLERFDKEQERREKAKTRVGTIVGEINEKKRHLDHSKTEIDMFLSLGITAPVCAAMTYGFVNLFHFCDKGVWILTGDMGAFKMAIMIAAAAGATISVVGGAITGLIAAFTTVVLPAMLLEERKKIIINVKAIRSLKRDIGELKKELAGLEKEGIEEAKEALKEIEEKKKE